MNLSKLTLAPWLATPGKPNEDEVAAWTVFGNCRPGGHLAIAWSQPQADAEFIALARNAFDVMMRRGWHAMPDSEKWFVFGECSMVLQAAKMDGPWPDPFTALVEADAWYRQHVEKE